MGSPIDNPLHTSQICRLRFPALYRTNSTFANPAWDRATLRVLIVRLSAYDVVSQSFSHLFLAQEARRASEKIYIDFAFMPCPRDRRVLAKSGAPPLIGCQSHLSAASFDALLVSWTYVTEIMNLPWLLSSSGIALYESQRTRPLVLLGGSAALACAVLFSRTGESIPDAVYFGEGERRVGEILQGLEACETGGRKAWLAEAAGRIEGLWAPGGAGVVRAARCEGPRSDDLVTAYPVLPGPEATTARLQITYGCRFTCAFCLEGQSRRPYRELASQSVMQAALALKRHAGASKIELSSYNFGSHSEIDTLLLKLNERFDSVGVMSQRPDELYRHEGLLDLELAGEKRSFTLGVEGLSERLRRFLDKSVTATDITGVLKELVARRVREVKLFYIVTGYENSDDLAQFDGFCAWLGDDLHRAGRRTRIIFSANRLVRMPFTPLEFDPVILDRGRLDTILNQFSTAVTQHAMEVRTAEPWSDYLVQQLLVSGLQGIHETVIALAGRGVTFDGSVSAGTAAAFERVVSAGIPAGLTVTSAGFVAAGSGRDARFARYTKLRTYLDGPSGRATSPAGQSPVRPVGTPISRTAIARLDETIRSRKRLVPRFFTVILPKEVAGMGSEWLGAWLSRAILGDAPDLAERLLNCREMLWYPAWGESVAWYGFTVIGITVQNPEDLRLEAAKPWILSEYPACKPEGAFPVSAVLRAPLDTVERPEEALGRFLIASHAPATVRREDDGWYRLEMGRQAKKSKVVLGGRYKRGPEEFIAELDIGGRFQAQRLIEELGGANHRPDALYGTTLEVCRLAAGPGGP
ncbi:MAG: hypothetical protein JW852_11000 [Spirochaetales bacterium]|nr:hypothetical protein [Spirochaetales bacterium]